MKGADPYTRKHTRAHTQKHKCVFAVIHCLFFKTELCILQLPRHHSESVTQPGRSCKEHGTEERRDAGKERVQHSDALRLDTRSVVTQ